MTDDPTLTPQPIETAEIVETEKPAFDITAYNATLEVVRRRLSLLQKADEELKLQKEMFENLLINDPQYQEAEAAVKEVTKKKTDQKARIAKTPAAQGILSKIKSLSDDIKDNKQMLSSELMQYYQTAGVTEIEDSEGNVQEFEITIKLKGKRKAV